MVTFTYDEEVYTPQGAKQLPPAELRKEYSRLRSIAVKRLKNFEGTKYTNTNLYEKYADSFDILKNIKSDTELRYALTNVHHFLTLKSSTISGYKQINKVIVSRYAEAGYDFVNTDNIFLFQQFVETIKARYGQHLKYLPTVGELFEEAEKGFAADIEKEKNIPPEMLKEAFNAWLQKQDLQEYYDKGFEIPSVKLKRG